MSLEEFKKKVHEYNNETKEYVMGRELVSLIISDTTKIDMVDPPGGPYICTGMELNGKIVTGIGSMTISVDLDLNGDNMCLFTFGDEQGHNNKGVKSINDSW